MLCVFGAATDAAHRQTERYLVWSAILSGMTQARAWCRLYGLGKKLLIARLRMGRGSRRV